MHHSFDPFVHHQKVTGSCSVNEREGSLPLEKHSSYKYVLDCFVIDLRLINMSIWLLNSKQKRVHKEPLSVDEHKFFMNLFIQEALTEENTMSECIHTVAASYGCKILQPLL